MRFPANDPSKAESFRAGIGVRGVALDSKGNLWVAAGVLNPRGPGETKDVPPGVYVITPEGKLLGRIPIPEDLITNLAFGGPDRKTLFLLAAEWRGIEQVNEAVAARTGQVLVSQAPVPGAGWP